LSQAIRPAKRHGDTKKLNVLVATDNQLIRFGVGAMLKSLQVGSAESCEDVTAGMRPIRSGRFHVLVLSTSLGDEQCTMLAAEAAEFGVKVLLLLDSSEAECAARLSKMSVNGFLLQDELTVEMLDDTLRRVMQGELPMPSRLARELLTRVSRGEPDQRRITLTPREQEILSLLAQGMSNKQIAGRLDISEHGTKRHVANVLAKLNCPNRTMAAALAIREGILAQALPRGKT
jgi:two-component system nitrate/nitrite response regulator NarL